MKFAVIVFPGSNSDRDAWYAAGQVLGPDESFSGSGSGNTGGGSPDQTWQWALAPVP